MAARLKFTMSHQSQILLVSLQDAQEDKILHALTVAGFTVSTSTFPELAAALTSNRPTDCLVFNVDGLIDADKFKSIIRLATRIKANPPTSRLRILCIGIAPQLIPQTDQPSDLLAEETHQFDDLLFSPLRIPAITARIKAQARLNTLQSEVIRRAAIKMQYNIDDDYSALIQSLEITNARILITGRQNGLGIIERTVSPYGNTVIDTDSRAALARLNQQNFDMMIINCGHHAPGYIEYVTEIRKNPSHFNLPILFIAHPSKMSESHIPFEAGVTDILDSPLNPSELYIRAHSLMLEYRLRASMASTCQDAKTPTPTNDPLTGLYNYSFYQEHLKEITRDHKKAHRVFTTILLELENIEQINKDHGCIEGDKVLRQISEILITVIRGEDLASRIGGHRFALTLPDTNEDHALNVLSRIESIMKQTIFMSGMSSEKESQPISVSLKAQIIETSPDTPEKQPVTPEPEKKSGNSTPGQAA